MPFTKKNFLEIQKMSLEELSCYYRELRKYQYSKDLPLRGIELRKLINGFLIACLKVNRLFNKQNLIILNDNRKKTAKTKIYASTHQGRYDVEMCFEAIKHSCYLLMGDPGETYRNLDGFLLWLKGIIYVDTDRKYKEDRHICYKTCQKLLQSGGNILIYPEGAYNIIENELVMKLYDGVAKLALTTDSEIIPIAVERYAKTYYASIGTNITKDELNSKDIAASSEYLRSILAGLKMEILEQMPIDKRQDLEDNAKELFIQHIMEDTPSSYTIEDIERSRYQDQTKIPSDEVFAFMKKIDPNLDNAFLFNKR